MSENKKEAKSGDCYLKWVASIKSDEIHNVLVEVKDIDIDAKRALSCLVAVSQLCYERLKDGKQFKSLPEDVVQLTERLCSLYSSGPSNNTLRYLTCLYHITNYLFNKNYLDHMAAVFKIVVKFKQTNLKSYQDDAKSLHLAFTVILRDAVVKVVSKNDTPEGRAFLTELFCLLPEINKGNKTFLEFILQAVHVIYKRDDKQKEYLITTGLKVFYKSDSTKDTNTLLTLIFQIYTYLFISQCSISDCHSALVSFKSQLDFAKKKFSENTLLGECFSLMYNSVNIFMWDCPLVSTLKKIQENIHILETFQNKEENENVLATCGFVLFLFVYSQPTERKGAPVIPSVCVKIFLTMFQNFYAVLKNSPSYKADILRAMSLTFLLLADANPPYQKFVLKSCLTEVLKTEECIRSILEDLRSVVHPNVEKDTILILVRFANLIRTYHLAELKEEVVAICKPICKFFVSLPSDVFENSQNLKALELCFTCLMGALGIEQIGKAQECLVVWLSKCPKSSQKAFQILGTLKHNLVCEKREDGLETNMWTVINERKSILEKEWPPLDMNIVEIGNCLLQELKTYSEAKTLRGMPLVSAANALLDLDVDCLTHVKALVIGMDVATANPNFAELCKTYHNKSKSLKSSLLKQKKKYNQIEFNCCMGDLLYAQLRYQLKYLRTECECEMVKLTVSPKKPLVAELPESRPDPNDTCDVATRFHHLSLIQQRKLMDAMDTAIRHWEFACTMLKDSAQDNLDLRVTLINLKDAGLLLKLYCDDTKEEKIWNILYNMANMLGDDNMVVQAGGELKIINKSLAPEITEKVATIIQKNPDLPASTTLSYTLRAALFALKNTKIRDGLACLKKFEEAQNKSNIQITQSYSLIGLFQFLPDWKKYSCSFRSCPSFHLSLHLSLRHNLSHVKEKNWRSFGELCEQQQDLMLVSSLLGEANWALDHPREARSYIKTVLPIAQKLALPLRTVQLLLLLAWVDLNTGVAEDCALKLNGIEELLEICGTPVIYGHSVDSPYLDKTMLSPPDFLSHPPACQCLPCSTIEYRRLVLETVTLRASFCAAFGRSCDADQSFQVAMLIEEKLCKSDIPEVCKSCAKMWVRYTEFKGASYQKQAAVIANEKAIQLLSSAPDPIAQQRAFEQRAILQYSLLQPQFTPIGPKVVIEAQKSTPPKIQTPKSQKNAASRDSPLATKDTNIKPVTPFLRPVRRLRIPSSGEENTPVATSKQKRKTKVLPKFPIETPQSKSKLYNSSGTPFVIVDDNGLAVGVSGKKSVSRSRKKTTDGSGFLQEPKITYKKKLFSSSTSKSNKSASSTEPEEPIITRKTIQTVVKTYGKEKLNSKKGSSPLASPFEISERTTDESTKASWNGDVFSFDQLKDSLTEIVSRKSNLQEGNQSVNSSPLEKQSTGFSSQKSFVRSDPSKSRDMMDSKRVSIDSNCEYVEGTPPEFPKPSVSLIPKRVTRSNKNSTIPTKK